MRLHIPIITNQANAIEDERFICHKCVVHT